MPFEYLPEESAKHNDIHRQAFNSSSSTTTTTTTTTSGFVLRSDEPSGPDWEETGSKAVLNTDGNAHELDMSSIVPDGAKLILLRVIFKDDIVGSNIYWRKPGSTYWRQASVFYVTVVDVYHTADILVPCSTDRIVEYQGNSCTWTFVDVTVAGWWI